MSAQPTLTLPEFLLRCIGEDEAAAKAGISGQADPENGWGYGGFGSPNALTPHVGIIHERVQAEHIIRWHPARVLAECEAKRQIVELAQNVWQDTGVGDPYEEAKVYGKVLPLLALPYADRPGYREEWKP